MHRHLSILIALALLSVAAVVATSVARPAAHGADVSRIKDTIKLPADAKSAEPVKIGTRIEGEVTFSRTTFFDRQVVSAQCKVTNPTDETIHIGYNAAVFDADGNLLGCTGMTTDIDGKDWTYLGVIIEMPMEQLEQVASYQAVLYESDHELGE